MKLKYVEIQKVINECDEVEYLLKEQHNPDIGFFNATDVCLDNRLWFNTTSEIKEVLERHTVNSLEDVYEYCNRNNLHITKERITEEGLIVGFDDKEIQYLIGNNLEEVEKNEI